MDRTFILFALLPFVGLACGTSVTTFGDTAGTGGTKPSGSTSGPGATGNGTGVGGAGTAGTSTAGTGAASTGTGSTLQCKSDMQCWAGAPHCDLAQGVCTGCVGPADCAPFQQVCDKGTGSCVDCASNADCAMMPGGICDTISHTCTSACTMNAQCNHGVCNAGVCVDCKADGDCMQGQRCDTGAHLCVDCLTSMDCPADMPFCSSHTCGVACKTDAACMGGMGGGVCDTAHGVCVECLTNAQCMGGVCQLDHTCGGMGGMMGGGG